MLKFNRFPFTIYFSPTEDPGGEADEEEVEEEEIEEESDDEEVDGKPEDEDDEEAWDYERGMTTIRKLRKEVKDANKTNKALAARLDKYEKAEQDKKDAEKSDLEKATELNQSLVTENTGLKIDLKKERIGRKIELEAYMMGFADPQNAYHLIMANNPSKIEYDEETGEVSGHKKLLEKLAEEKPYLVSTDVADRTRRTPPRENSKKGDRRTRAPESLDDQPVDQVLDIPSSF